MLLNFHYQLSAIIPEDRQRFMNSRKFSSRIILNIEMNIDDRADDLRYFTSQYSHNNQFRWRPYAA